MSDNAGGSFLTNKYVLFGLQILLLALMFFHPNISFADDSGVLDSSGSSHFFDPAIEDQSILYLGQIFGNVGTVLAGSGSMLLSTMFGIFNSAVMALGIIFAAYTTVMGIMNTAGEGQFLGQKMSSIWVPIRTVAGIALLIPMKTSGYCVIQVFFMWLVVQGIGAADSIWSAVVDYLAEGNPTYVTTSYSDYALFDSTIEVIYQGLACQQSLYKYYPNDNANPVSPEPSTSNDVVTYTYYGYQNNTKVTCGEFSFDTSDDTTSSDYIMADAKEQALEATSPTLNSVAYYYVTYPDEDDRNQATYDFVGSDFLNTIEGTYNSYIQGASSKIANQNNDKGQKALLESSTKKGWISAGQYYFMMADLNNETDDSSMTDSTLAWDDSEDPGTLLSASSLSSIKSDTDDAGDFIQDLANTRDDAEKGSSKALKKKSKTGMSALPVASLIRMVTNSMTNTLDSTNLSTNPVILAQKLGHKIIIAVEASWAAMFGVSMLMAFSSGWNSSTSPGALMMKTFLAYTTPLVLALLGALLTLGGTLAVLIPMMPFMIFTFAVVAWFVVVIETEVAAPIVALGIMHPEGHEVWGKGEPAVMMIINVFLRPSMLLISLMSAMLLSYVSVSVVNFGFDTAMGSVLNANDGATSVIEVILFLSLYVGMVLAVLNQTFGMIGTLPGTVMKWIQGGEAAVGMGGDGKEQTQEAKGQFDSGNQGTAQAHKEGASSGGSSAQGSFEQKSQSNAAAAEKKKDQDFQRELQDNNSSTDVSGEKPEEK